MSLRQPSLKIKGTIDIVPRFPVSVKHPPTTPNNSQYGDMVSIGRDSSTK